MIFRTVFNGLLWYSGQYFVNSTIIHHFLFHTSSQCSSTPNYYCWFNKNDERLWRSETEKGNFRMAFHRKEVNTFASSVAPHRKRETKIRRERKIRKRKRRRERSIIVRTPQGLHPFLLLSSLIPLAHPPTNNTPLHRHQYRFSALCTVYNCTEL